MTGVFTNSYEITTRFLRDCCEERAITKQAKKADEHMDRQFRMRCEAMGEPCKYGSSFIGMTMFFRLIRMCMRIDGVIADRFIKRHR